MSTTFKQRDIKEEVKDLNNAFFVNLITGIRFLTSRIELFPESLLCIQKTEL